MLVFQANGHGDKTANTVFLEEAGCVASACIIVNTEVVCTHTSDGVYTYNEEVLCGTISATSLYYTPCVSMVLSSCLLQCCLTYLLLYLQLSIKRESWLDFYRLKRATFLQSYTMADDLQYSRTSDIFRAFAALVRAKIVLFCLTVRTTTNAGQHARDEKGVVPHKTGVG